ncbi:hypothetical protein Phum_PHUM576440 [Pediculus humanus corporis]|uniref:Uncharacterized protein n=1 Tax=Pediculus humanus subsp. corporis TaxID=121224 RepID=E0W1F6_PEDHC|nr:uncharacterized protein Phum_PHUM576440 [Pediculus humanus corporis]EEB19462.1 hypothetical protein Phum_PHUM576440 [Pediculus humanus corporis]
MMLRAFAVCFVILITVNFVSSRWLPTRSQEDRLDKLKEMLKDLLESEIERANIEGKYMYKRDVNTQIESIQPKNDHDDKKLFKETNNNNKQLDTKSQL